MQVPVLARHQPAHLRQPEMLGVGRAHADQLAVRVAPARGPRWTHHAQALRALVADVPLLEEVAVRVADLLLVPRADAPESLQLVALLLRQLSPGAGAPGQRPARHVVVDGGDIVAGLRG